MRMLLRVSGLSKASDLRDYTIEAEWFDAYRAWARDHAGP